jgi:hypothetical protein
VSYVSIPCQIVHYVHDLDDLDDLDAWDDLDVATSLLRCWRSSLAECSVSREAQVQVVAPTVGDRVPAYAGRGDCRTACLSCVSSDSTARSY